VTLMQAVHAALDWVDPVTALAGFEHDPYTLLLHGGGAEARGRYSYLCAWPAFTVEDADAAAGLARLRDRYQAQPSALNARTGFQGGFAGLMGYDLGQAVECVPPCPSGLADWPVLAMGWYDAALVFDHQTRTVQAAGARDAAERLIARYRDLPDRSVHAGAGRLDQVWSDDAYRSAVQRARAYIRDGDIFQVNLSHPFRGRVTGRDAPYGVFQRLSRDSAAAFSAYFRLDADRVIVTNSPERFVRLDPDGHVQARPIKGTRPRRDTPQADQAEARALAVSVKDRAENLMIVDLMRNDLSRICLPGSVKTPELFAVEGFANVHHLVSTVEGQLEAGRDVFDLIEAAFPPGSITGAPKVRAMEIIAELEAESRGAYCGALGWIGVDGAADLNVMIRTAAFVRQAEHWAVEVRSGGAITIDSDPQAELEETRAKAAALKAAIEGGA